MSNGSKKILVVEDDPDISTIYSFVLRQEGYEVAAAFNGLQALDQIVTFKPDVMLLDLMMPEMDGIGVLEAMHNDTKFASLKPIVLVMTNLNQPAMKERAKELGASGYIVKVNIVPHDIITIVETAFDRRANEKQAS